MFSWLLCREVMVFHSGVCGDSTRVFSWLLCREVMVFQFMGLWELDQGD